MSTPRFYLPPPLPSVATIELPPAAAHHASRVLRLRIGDAVHVFDGEGREMRGVIREISARRVQLGELESCAVERESPLHIVLAQAMSSSEKMDWVVQKATELGAAEIQPLQTKRSVTRLSGERAERRTEHWHGVAIAACEQCGRNVLPRVLAPLEFSAWVAQMRATPTHFDAPGSKLILLPQGATALHALPRPQGSVTLLIGPEGGFTVDEEQVAQHAGFIPVSLGARILRTETAAMAGIAALQTLWGDFN
jgi:16S rRNA (uracil1498-N3)-methyltransferase